MMPEGNETPGGEPSGPREGPLTPLGRGEADLLAERRARRAAEGGELALTRRAEAAEATVETLERHVASLRQRLQEAQEEQARVAELLELERASTLAGEDELRRVRQREYAEQQLRVEAEERLAEADRSARLESELVARRLTDGEHRAQQISERLEALQRQLAEVDQASAAERARLVGAEAQLRARVEELERRAGELERVLEHERAARERGEELLESMRQGHSRLEAVLADIRGLLRRLATALARREESTQPPPAPAYPRAATAPRASEPALVVEQGAGPEMADALAAAVERLRARAETAPVAEAQDAPALAPPQQPTRAEAAPAPHKHSMSAISRWRKRRKQRKGASDGRRSAS